MAKLLQIAQLGNSLLREKALEIKNPNSAKIKNLINDMITTLKDSNGVGIAAPQVYESKRMFILASKPSVKYPDALKMKPTVIINPKIIKLIGKKKKDWEGCLSIPGIRALVPRYSSVKVEFFNKDGKKKSKLFKDFIARIFQHEFDHLEGLVFLDRIETAKDIVTEKEYQKLISREKK
jgi:peptide deformylase